MQTASVLPARKDEYLQSDKRPVFRAPQRHLIVYLRKNCPKLHSPEAMRDSEYRRLEKQQKSSLRRYTIVIVGGKHVRVFVARENMHSGLGFRDVCCLCDVSVCAVAAEQG